MKTRPNNNLVENGSRHFGCDASRDNRFYTSEHCPDESANCNQTNHDKCGGYFNLNGGRDNNDENINDEKGTAAGTSHRCESNPYEW